MYLKLSWRWIKNNLFINSVIMLMLISIFLIVFSVISVFIFKVEKYSALSNYFDKNGVFILSNFLQEEIEDENYFIRDADELKESISGTIKVETISSLVSAYVLVDGMENAANVMCYSNGYINSLSPEMESGSWFQAKDSNSQIIQAVATHNSGNINTGDIITIKNEITDAIIEIEIIGVIKDNESIFYYNAGVDNTNDYRDCYYTYNYEAEDKVPAIILSDYQILYGKYCASYDALNYRLNSENGFQRMVTGQTFIIFDDDMSKDEIWTELNKISSISDVYSITFLSEMKENSLKYIYTDIRDYFIIVICMFVFIVIVALSAAIIMIKKQLYDYSVFYLCGMQWKYCVRVSLMNSLIISIIALVITIFSIEAMTILGGINNTALKIGWYQIGVCLLIIILFILLTWIIPKSIVRRGSPKSIMLKNR